MVQPGTRRWHKVLCRPCLESRRHTRRKSWCGSSVYISSIIKLLAFAILRERRSSSGGNPATDLMMRTRPKQPLPPWVQTRSDPRVAHFFLGRCTGRTRSYHYPPKEAWHSTRSRRSPSVRTQKRSCETLKADLSGHRGWVGSVHVRTGNIVRPELPHPGLVDNLIGEREPLKSTRTLPDDAPRSVTGSPAD